MDGKLAVAFIGVRLTIAVASNVGNVSFRACSLVLCKSAFSLNWTSIHLPDAAGIKLVQTQPLNRWVFFWLRPNNMAVGRR